MFLGISARCMHVVSISLFLAFVNEMNRLSLKLIVDFVLLLRGIPYGCV